MGKQYIDVEVTVTSTVTYRLPRPTKAEVVDAMSPDDWDKDDPESSIREYIESQGIEDFIKGFRPVSIFVDEMAIAEVMPAGKGQKPQEARPFYKIKASIRKDDGNVVEAWFAWNTWRRVGDELMGDVLTADACESMAEVFKRHDAKRLIEGRQWESNPQIFNIELIPFQPKL